MMGVKQIRCADVECVELVEDKAQLRVCLDTLNFMKGCENLVHLKQ